MLSRAINGKILLQLLEEKLPNILFPDLLMPCVDGCQCLKEIRANKKYDAIPIIIYSSSTINELKIILERILTIN